ncbi:T9SS type A sorting domain-containing protein [Salinibacter ruber]
MAVQITVYDLLGRSVKAPVRGQFEAGRHRTRLSTSDLAPGMYFVRMRVLRADAGGRHHPDPKTHGRPVAHRFPQASTGGPPEMLCSTGAL